MCERLIDRQTRFLVADSLEKVLQDPIRIRKMFLYLKLKSCSELLEFWALAELYQNLYWKPLKLLGFYDEISMRQSKKMSSATDGLTGSQRATVGIHSSTAEKSMHCFHDEDETNDDDHGDRETFADLLSCFSIDVEEKLRKKF